MNSPSSAGVFAWQPGSWLVVRGSDAAGFLQGQFTNDLRGAAGAVYGLWLNTKGKVLADSFVIPLEDGSYRVCSYHGSPLAIRERLESHIIADDVEIADETAEMAAVTIVGGAHAATLADEVAHATGGRHFPGHRIREEHYELVFPKRNAPLVAQRTATLPAISAAEMERRRIASSIAAIPQDIGPNDLPNEGGLEIDAISYTKGCYLGQEVMARLKNLGQVRRKLLRVSGRLADLPTLPAALYVGNRAVGELRSASVCDGQAEGLALLTLIHLQPNTGLAFSAGGASVLAVIDPP